MMMSRIYDLSQPLESGMSYFPGDPEPVIRAAQGVTPPWRVSQLSLGSHTGTHIDAAAHYIASGKSIEGYPLERFVLPGIVISVSGMDDDQAISAEQIAPGLERMPEGGAVLFRTAWDQYWKTARYSRHPYLSSSAARALVEAGASLVGIDALNVDSTLQGTEHVHSLLLEKDVLIVENLAHMTILEPGRVYQFSFLPLRLTGLDGSPIRAVAWEI